MPKNRYAYLLVFDTTVGTVKEVSRFLDKREDIFLNWFTILPYSFFLVSDKSATELADVFRTFTRGRFIILDVDTDVNGWLPEAVWSFIEDPKAYDES